MRNTAVAIAICLSAIGCRQNPHVTAAIDSLNAERRLLEDVVYQQEFEYEDLLRKVEELEEENERLRRGERDDSSAPPPFDLSPRGRRDEADDELMPPQIEYGAPTTPESAAPDGQRPPGAADDQRLDAPRGAAGQRQPAPEEINPPVAQLHINPLYTTGADLDHKPGDDGLTIVVEPRSAAGDFVPQSGPLSIVLLDPSQEGEAARVARWDIDDAQARQSLQSGKSARGMRFDLPWPDGPPASAKLKLFVRMETPQGEKLEADQDVFVTLPGKFSQRWTPRPLDRPLDSRAGAAQIATAPASGRPTGEPAAEPHQQQRVSDARGAAAANSAGRAPQATSGALQLPEWKPTR